MSFITRIFQTSKLSNRNIYGSINRFYSFNKNVSVISACKKLSPYYFTPDSLLKRQYGHGPPMNREIIGDRLCLLLQLYDKVDPERVSLDAEFHKDLGLNSLDLVELMMTVEEEFGFEVPYLEGEKMKTPNDYVQYICDKFDVFH